MTRIVLAALAMAVGGTGLVEAAVPPMQPEAFVTGQLVIIGITTLLILGMLIAVSKLFDGRANAWARDDDSTFGRHRLDPLAHENMRKQIATDFKQELAAIRDEMQRTSERHHEAVLKILDQNGRLLELLSPQMRRQPRGGD